MDIEDSIPLPEGATPLDPDETEGLIPELTTRSELNFYEQANIAKAILWSRESRKLKQDLLSIDSLCLLHKTMFDETWRWAGQFRPSGKNIGVEPHQIITQLGNLCADGKYWIENKSFATDEIAVRFHHRLVSVHPFFNGNGRHARLVADLLLLYAKLPALTWGGQSLDVEGATRSEYLSALRRADKGNYKQLLDFARA